MNELNSQRSHTTGLIEDAAPQLVVEEMNFARHANADARRGFRHGQGTCSQVWRVFDLLGNTENALARRFVNSRASMQSAVDGSNGNVS
jgi:hypothetical protein